MSLLHSPSVLMCEFLSGMFSTTLESMNSEERADAVKDFSLIVASAPDCPQLEDFPGSPNCVRIGHLFAKCLERMEPEEREIVTDSFFMVVGKVLAHLDARDLKPKRRNGVVR